MPNGFRKESCSDLEKIIKGKLLFVPFIRLQKLILHIVLKYLLDIDTWKTTVAMVIVWG